VAGIVQFANLNGPGWGHPETGSFEDVRLVGRDQRRYGPLPREWGQYRGLYQYGDQVILSYSVGTVNVLEMPGVVAGSQATVKGDATSVSDGVPVFTRTFQIAPRTRPMLLKVATHPSKNAKLEQIAVDAADRGANPIAMLAASKSAEASAPVPPSFSGKSRIAVKKPDDFDLTTKDYSITARVRTKAGGTILCQAPVEGKWAPDGKSFFIRGGRLAFDIGWVGAVTGKTNIADDRWHDVAMTWQHQTGDVRFYVDGKLDGQGRLKPKGKVDKQAIRLGFTSPDFPDPTFFVGQLADVRFIQSHLSEEEIVKVAQFKGDALLAHWKLDSLSANVIQDETGKGHDGKLAGGFRPS